MTANSSVCDWTLGAWPFDSTTAMLTLHSGHKPNAVLDDAVLADWVAAIRASDFQRVRTNAIGPWLADQLTSLGFRLRQELDLLVLRDASQLALQQANRRTKRINPHTAVRVDVAAFGDEWALDPAALHHAVGATARSRMRGVASGNGFVFGRCVGYHLTGVTDDTAYLQRLAVVPAARRRGVASTLVNDALRWAVELGAHDVFVNTDVDNVAALSLYRQWGFVSVGYHLRVLECDRATLVRNLPGGP